MTDNMEIHPLRNALIAMQIVQPVVAAVLQIVFLVLYLIIFSQQQQLVRLLATLINSKILSYSLQFVEIAVQIV